MFGRKNDQVDRAKDAERRRDEALDELDKQRRSLMSARAGAKEAVSDCLELLSSMRSKPFKMKRHVRSIERSRKRFRKSDELVEMQFARDSIATGAAVMAVGGLLGAVYRFRSEIAGLIKKRPPLAIAGILGILAGATLAINKIGSFFIKKSAKEWAEFTEECLKVAEEAMKASLSAKNSALEISRQADGLKACLDQLVSLRGGKFGDLRSDVQDRVWQLLLNAETLAAEINAEVVA